MSVDIEYAAMTLYTQVPRRRAKAHVRHHLAVLIQRGLLPNLNETVERGYTRAFTETT